MLPSLPPTLEQEEYAVQDTILQYISKKFISITPEDRKYYNFHLKIVTKMLIERMKKESPFFKEMFAKERVAGSYWDKLKVGKPVEFDKNFILRMPKTFSNFIDIKPAEPSFVFVNVGQGLKELKKNKAKWEIFKKMDSWVDQHGMLLTNAVRYWMESVVDKALKRLQKDGDKYLLVTEVTTYKLKTVKAGPAITVQVEICDTQDTEFHIDMVPAFEFSKEKWPSHVVPCPSDSPSKNWHLVPKPIRLWNTDSSPPNTLWRLSFHDQESSIIHDTYHLKAVLKLLKKLRDVKEQKLLSSYAIKTIFLWEKKKQEDKIKFWRQRLSSTFLHMLRVLIEQLHKQVIPFYWDQNHNLLGQLSESQMFQLYSTFLKIHNNIIGSLTNRSNRLVIAEEILSLKEFQKLPADLINYQETRKEKRKRRL